METRLQVIAHSTLLQVSPQMADIASHRGEKNFLNATKLDIVGVGSIGLELITALRLTAQNQVAAILLTILACAVVLCSLSTILRSWYK